MVLETLHEADDMLAGFDILFLSLKKSSINYKNIWRNKLFLHCALQHVQ